ncbi:MAG: restriction endonuclease subunit S [Bacteroidales bacterium]|nr:restriction endonuclease subunit S [Bacteroidales bacterium]
MSEEKLIPELRFPEFKNEGEWKESVLGSVVEMKGRIGYRGYTTEDIVDKGKGAITLSPSNFNENGHLNFEKCTYISWDKYEESPEIQLEEGQTVLVKTASVGKTAYVDKLPEKATVNPQIVVLKPKSIHNRFLAFTVSHQNTQNQIRNNVGAGAIPNISQEIISKLEILLPPDVKRKEQQKIASCLSSLDEVITAHSLKLELLKDHKKGLMQNLFPHPSASSGGGTVAEPVEAKVPKYRFKEFEKDGEWGEKKLGEVSKMQAGKFVSATEIKDKLTEGLFPCYGGNGLRGYTKSFTNTGTYSLIGRQGALCGNITLAEGNFHATEHAVVVTPKTNIDTIWLYYELELLNLNQYATGQAQPGLSVSNLEQVELSLPRKLAEQQKIATCLSSLDALITAQAEKIEQLKLHKKGLMQGLFPKIND